MLKDTEAVAPKTERPEQIDKVEQNNKGVVAQYLENRQREITRKTEGLDKKAEGIAKSRENRIIIPTNTYYRIWRTDEAVNENISLFT